MTNSFQPGFGLRGKRVLLAGGTGFIGSWVARLLARCGCELSLAVRSLENLRHLTDTHGIRGEAVVADFTEPGAFTRAFQGTRPHVTINLSGYGVHPSEQNESVARHLNVRLVTEMAEAVAASPASDWKGVQLLHAGSGAEYGPVKGPVSESSPTNPASLYGRTKLEGTQALTAIAARSGIRALTVRFFTVYGFGERPGRLIPTLLHAARSHEQVSLTSGSQSRDFTYVEDVAEGVVRLACTTQPIPPVVNLCTGTMQSVKDVVLEAAAVLQLRHGQLEFGAEPARTHDLAQGAISTTLLKQLVGWSPSTSVTEGIQRMLQFEARRKVVSI